MSRAGVGKNKGRTFQKGEMACPKKGSDRHVLGVTGRRYLSLAGTAKVMLGSGGISTWKAHF